MLNFPLAHVFGLDIVELQIIIFISLFCTLKDFLFIAYSKSFFKITIIFADSNINLFFDNSLKVFNF